uniref:non-specific lipid transfer protein GPI-anchored 5-like n=1 Tax=Erigeron canadensis TaxID=72917 RepID=UPI001CB8BB90|nr:non-specific lipid transfer protein GPI-anchored 5-like [Erigeron canadensis]
MAPSGILVLAAFSLVTMFWEGSIAQSGCINVLIGMSPCLNYVTGSSKMPSSSCCSSLANVVKSQPKCLCAALDGSTLTGLGISINKTVALALPSVCDVKTPPVSRCQAENNAPTMAPAESPKSSKNLNSIVPTMAPVESPKKSKGSTSNGPSPTGGLFIAGPKQVLESP